MCSQLESAIVLAINIGIGLVVFSVILSGLFIWKVWLPSWIAVRLLAEPPVVQRRRSWHRGEGMRPSVPSGPPTSTTAKPPSNR